MRATKRESCCRLMTTISWTWAGRRRARALGCRSDKPRCPSSTGYRVRSEGDARDALDTQDAFLVEPLLVGGADRLDVGVGAAGRLVPDNEDVGLLPGEVTVAAAPLARPAEHGEAGWEAGRHFAVDKRGPLLDRKSTR